MGHVMPNHIIQPAAQECGSESRSAIVRPEMETARPERERAADEAVEAGNLNGKDSKPASMLFAEASAARNEMRRQ